MELRRFFVSDSDIDGDSITVRGDEFRHMTKVLRLKKGFKAIVCANDGKERHCVIDKIENDFATLTVERVDTVDRKSVSLTLFCGVLKNQNLDLVVRKAVELGVDVIVPFVSANTAETRFNEERASRIALESAKQCGAVYLSKIEQVCGFDEMLERFPDYSTVVFAYEEERKTALKQVDFQGDRIALVVGSEGGFKREERDRAEAQGAKIVTLGRRILRAETADIVACALTLDALGELDYD